METWTATCLQLNLPHQGAGAGIAGSIFEQVRTAVHTADQAIDELTGDIATDLFVFPEFFFGGFPGEDLPALVDIPGPAIELVQDLARRRNAYVASTVYARVPEFPDRYFNTSFIINRSGDVILLSYRIHTMYSHSPHDLWTEFLDKMGFEAAFPVVQTDLGNLAVFPSYEILYPEVSRAHVLQGAEVLIHPLGDPRFDFNNAVRRVRAFENATYLLSCTTPSQSTDVEQQPEGSVIVDWAGRVTASVGRTAFGACSAPIDIAALRQETGRTAEGRAQMQTLRPEMFAALYDRIALYPANTIPDSWPADVAVHPSRLTSQLDTSHRNLMDILARPPKEGE